MKCKECNKETEYKVNKKYCMACKKEKVKSWKKISDKKHYQKTKNKKYKISLKEYLEITKQCFICMVDKSISCHHKIPKSKGGEDKISNYLGVCFNCHHFIHKGMSISEIRAYYKKRGIPLNKNRSQQWK